MALVVKTACRDKPISAEGPKTEVEVVKSERTPVVNAGYTGFFIFDVEHDFVECCNDLISI